MANSDELGGGVALLQGARAFNKEVAPAFLDHVCMLAGQAPPPGSPVGEGQDAGFAWCELHCGSATTATLLAAANPLGDFHGIDARESLIEEGRALASDGGVKNLTLHKADLEQARDLSLPAFDYVVVSGIYSWVPARERARVLAFLRQFLKPGGVAYVTYNARPGWNRLEPFRRLYREVTRGLKASPHQRLAAAREFYAGLEQARAPAILATGVSAAALSELESLPAEILAADYANDFADPLYVTEVASDFAAIDCALVGSAEMGETLPVLMAHEPFKSALGRLPTPWARELAKDMLRDTRFRRDVFVRGGQRLSADNREMMTAGLGFVLERPGAEILYNAKVPFGEIRFDTPQSHHLVETLGAAPRSLGELLEGLDSDGAQAVVANLHALLLSGQARPVYRRSREAAASATRLQSAITARAATPSAVGFLPSALGTAFQVPVVDQLFGAEPDGLTADALAEMAMAQLGEATVTAMGAGAIKRRARGFARARAHYRALGLEL